MNHRYKNDWSDHNYEVIRNTRTSVGTMNQEQSQFSSEFPGEGRVISLKDSYIEMFFNEAQINDTVPPVGTNRRILSSRAIALFFEFFFTTSCGKHFANLDLAIILFIV